MTDFGAFVEIEPGIEGLIHISQLSRARVEKPGDVLRVGQEVTARILEIDPAMRRIRLSLKSLQPEDERRPRDEGAPRGEREHRSRRDDGDRRQGKDRGPQMPTEEISMTIGDFLKSRESESD